MANGQGRGVVGGRRGYRVAAVTAVAVGLVIISVFALQPAKGRARLLALPEAQLAYPGAERLVALTGYEGTSGAEAAVATRFATMSSIDEVIDYYDRQLTAMGWSRGGGMSIVGSIAEAQICGWHNNTTTARLSFWKMDEYKARHPDDPPVDLAFDFRLADAVPEHDVGWCRVEHGN